MSYVVLVHEVVFSNKTFRTNYMKTSGLKYRSVTDTVRPIHQIVRRREDPPPVSDRTVASGC
jgi:hypothetical protein